MCDGVVSLLIEKKQDVKNSLRRGEPGHHKRPHLGDDDGARHAGALVGLAVVPVGSGHVEGVGHLLAGAIEVILVGDGVGVDAGGDVVLVEDDVVGERLVVHELDGLALGDGDRVGLFALADFGGMEKGKVWAEK